MECKPTGSTWRWSRTAETRRTLLRAAREVFAEEGFAGAGVADVVARAGSTRCRAVPRNHHEIT